MLENAARKTVKRNEYLLENRSWWPVAFLRRGDFSVTPLDLLSHISLSSL